MQSESKQNIVNTAREVRKKYLEILSQIWGNNNKKFKEYSIFLSKFENLSNNLGDIRNFKNFRDSRFQVNGKDKQPTGKSIPCPKNYLMSESDFYFASPFPGKKQSEGIQPIIINEFQPEVMFYAASLFSGIASDVAGMTGFKKLADAYKKFAGDSDVALTKMLNATRSNSLLKQFSNNPNKLYDNGAYENSSDTFLHPIQMIKKMFDAR